MFETLFDIFISECIEIIGRRDFLLWMDLIEIIIYFTLIRFFGEHHDLFGKLINSFFLLNIRKLFNIIIVVNVGVIWIDNITCNINERQFVSVFWGMINKLRIHIKMVIIK